ncbi:MAG: hypothetical protein ABIP47_11310 [Saprospiraceae bacterium]
MIEKILRLDDWPILTIDNNILTMQFESSLKTFDLNQSLIINGFVIKGKRIDYGESGISIQFENECIYLLAGSPGFNKCLKFLVKKFKISLFVFYRIYFGSKKMNWLMWMQYSKNNVIVLPIIDKEEMLRNFSRGIRLDKNSNKLISWNLTVDELLLLKGIEVFYYSSAKPKLIRYKKAILIGPLEIEKFEVDISYQRTDVPATKYYAPISIDGLGKQNYYFIKKELINLLGNPDKSLENKISLFSEWDFQFLNISIEYQFDSSDTTSSGITHLNIENNRSYPEFWEDEYYENNYAISSFMHLDKEYKLQMYWKYNPYVRPMPKGIQRIHFQSDKQFIIWKDNVNERIGFGNSINAVIIPKLLILRIRRVAYVLDRGPTFEYLEALVYWKFESIWIKVATGNIGDFEKWDEPISLFLDMKVEFEKINC